MPIYDIQTFGCQMNHSDSERVCSLLERAGFVRARNSDDHVDFLVFNTCSVRQKAEDRALSFIRNKKKQYPNGVIAVTGCMVRETGDKETSSDQLLKFEGIDLVFRIEDTARLPKILERYFLDHDFSEYAQSFGAGTLENYFHINPKVENKAQVFVPIMQGCDKFCTYCIVPYTRGRELSRPMAEVLNECEKHVENGALEITLLGQNVNSYKDGADGPKCFAELLREVDKFHTKGLSRVRFTSAHPQDFTDDVIDALAEMKTSCPYVHLPVQHGANTMLRKMNRNYSVEKFIDIITRLRERIPETTLATDIIVGFPGETDEEFQTLLDFAESMHFDFSYTAIFSPRKNTPAARMEDLPMKIKKKRFHAFDEVIKRTSWKKREEAVGKTLEILVEKSEKNDEGLYINSGRSREFFEVFFESGRMLKGKEVDVHVIERKGYVLSGKLAEGSEQKPKKVVQGLRMVG